MIGGGFRIHGGRARDNFLARLQLKGAIEANLVPNWVKGHDGGQVPKPPW